MKASPFLLPVLACFAINLHAADENAAMLAGFQKEAAALDAEIAKGKGTVNQYSRRGDLRFFLGKSEEAVQDYQKMIELDPAQDGPHWRLGIALYFAGEPEKSAKQFEKYYAQDATGTDRETGIWHFIARAGIDGVSSARLQMLRYTKPDRPPFNELYDLFGDVMTTEEFFREMQKKGHVTNQEIMFYARLYAGIHEDLNGRRDQALKFLRMAATSPWGKKAGGGGAYMWQVSRVLVNALDTAPKEAPAEAPKEKKAE